LSSSLSSPSSSSFSLPAGDGLLSLTRALDFAARRHCDQRRKGAREEPYLNHLVEVLQLLTEALHAGGILEDVTDYVLLIGGVLHDVIEDTPTTTEEITALFGEEVAILVSEVTDDKSLPKAERKQRQIISAPHKSRRARLIKIADKTSNLRTLAISPPVGWSLRRQKEYIEWAQKVVAGCQGLNPVLDQRFAEALAGCQARTKSCTELLEE
jgi:(p)ppGpp synthase/HD superfamily hydrolase